MHRPSYAIARAITRVIGAVHMRHVLLHGERLYRPGGFVLACTHIGHLEPVLLSGVMRRPVHWLAREEFFRWRIGAVPLRLLGAISIDRRGVPVRAIRDSVRRLNEGRVIGIFPEGGRTHGNDQVIRGGPIRGGACTIALRAGVPIVPVVMLGIEVMHAVRPWMPGRRSAVHTIVGEPLVPPAMSPRIGRRERRRAMAESLTAAFVSLHRQLCDANRHDTGGAA